MVLEADPTGRRTVLQFRMMERVVLLGQLAVDPGGDHEAVGLDRHAVPPLGVVGPGKRWDVAVDGHCLVLVQGRVVWLVPKLELHTVARRPAVRQRPNSDAGISTGGYFVLQREREIGVRLFGADIASTLTAERDLAAFHFPGVDIARRPPAIKITAVEEGPPGRLLESNIGHRGLAAGHGQGKPKAAAGLDVYPAYLPVVDGHRESLAAAANDRRMHCVFKRFYFTARGECLVSLDDHSAIVSFAKCQIESLTVRGLGQRDDDGAAVLDRPAEAEFEVAEGPSGQEPIRLVAACEPAAGDRPTCRRLFGMVPAGKRIGAKQAHAKRLLGRRR